MKARRWLFWLWVVAVAGRFGPAAVASELPTEDELAPHGLVRAWFTQVVLDAARGRISDVVVDDGTVFVQTNRAVLQAIDEQTGQSLWVAEVGDSLHPSTTPGLSSRIVAALNGSRLMLLDRSNGKLLWETRLSSGAGAGPALSTHRVYVPMVNGMIVSYRIQAFQPAAATGSGQEPTGTPAQAEKVPSAGAPAKAAPPAGPAGKQAPAAPAAAGTPAETASTAEQGKAGGKAPSALRQRALREAAAAEQLRLQEQHVAPLYFQSLGRTLVQPLVTRQTHEEEWLAWPTDLGYLCVGFLNRLEHRQLELKYRLKTEAPIVSQPAYLPADPNVVGDSGVIYAASQDGYVHAIQEKDGTHLWRFSTGDPIDQAPVVIGYRVFVTSELGGLYNLDAKSGKVMWYTRGITRFLAASRTRLYTLDRLDRIAVLDARTGERLDTLVLPAVWTIRPANYWTDRLYLATESGLLMCLHEAGLTKPALHRTRAKEGAEITVPVQPAAEEGEPVITPTASTADRPTISGKRPAAAAKPKPPTFGQGGAPGSIPKPRAAPGGPSRRKPRPPTFGGR